MLVLDWATVETYLNEVRYDEELYAKAWRTAWYIWTIHKQGILCLVSKNEVCLVPFSNEQYNNRFAWPVNASALTFTLDTKSFARQDYYYYTKQAKHGIKESIIRDQGTWWLNGHLLCNTSGPWSTRGLDSMQKTLEASLLPWAAHKSIFFINRRDFPLLMKNSKVTPHWPVFGRKPELPMFYGITAWSPVLSYYASQDNSDILWPAPEQWDLSKTEFAPWPKKPKAVFRGTLTGRFTDRRNIRLSLHNSGHPDIDAGLTAWTPRCRIYGTNVVYNGPPDEFCAIKPMTLYEQSTFAILLYVPGHVASMRLAWHYLSGSCVVKIEDESCAAPLQWFDSLATEGHSFVANKHFLKTTFADLPNLLLQLHTHEGLQRLQTIGLEAQNVARRVFNPEFMRSYVRTLCMRTL